MYEFFTALKFFLFFSFPFLFTSPLFSVTMTLKQSSNLLIVSFFLLFIIIYLSFFLYKSSLSPNILSSPIHSHFSFPPTHILSFMSLKSTTITCQSVNHFHREGGGEGDDEGVAEGGRRESLSCLPRSVSLVLPAEQNPFKRLPELRTKDGVDNGIEGRVEVPEPQEDGKHDVGEVAAGADGHKQRRNEEGQPADDEGPRDNGESLSGLLLPLRLQRLLLRLLRRLLR